MTEDKILFTAKYVEGDLTSEERVAFENLLLHDEELRQHLADYQDIHGSLQTKLGIKNPALLATLKDLSAQHFTTAAHVQPKMRKLNLTTWLSAAAAVLVIGLLLWAPWNGSLYEQFASNPEMSVTERGAEKTDLDNAAVLFNNKQFEEAKLILASLHEADQTNSLVSFYYGLSLIATSELAKGRSLLAELTNGESIFKYDAAYELAMSYLKTGSNVDAKFWLEKIPDGAVQYDKAQELMKKL